MAWPRDAPGTLTPKVNLYKKPLTIGKGRVSVWTYLIPMNNSPLNEAEKRLRFSELRRDGQRNRVINLVKKAAVLNAALDIERDRLEQMKLEVKENYKTFIQIRDGQTV